MSIYNTYNTLKFAINSVWYREDKNADNDRSDNYIIKKSLEGLDQSNTEVVINGLFSSCFDSKSKATLKEINNRISNYILDEGIDHSKDSEDKLKFTIIRKNQKNAFASESAPSKIASIAYFILTLGMGGRLAQMSRADNLEDKWSEMSGIKSINYKV